MVFFVLTVKKMGRKCKTCHKSILKWDFHEECVDCRKTFNPNSYCDGSIARRCDVCKTQTENALSLYENRVEAYQGKGLSSPADRQPTTGEDKSSPKETVPYEDRVEKVTSLSLSTPVTSQAAPPPNLTGSARGPQTSVDPGGGGTESTGAVDADAAEVSGPVHGPLSPPSCTPKPGPSD